MRKQTSVIPGFYRHYKGGIYEVLGMAYIEADVSVAGVAYRKVLEDFKPDPNEKGRVWIRPLKEFSESVNTCPDKMSGVYVWRFERLGHTGHVREEHVESCNSQPHCPICDGGLARCVRCGLTDADLTTHCPGDRESFKALQDKIQAGTDYFCGRWEKKETVA